MKTSLIILVIALILVPSVSYAKFLGIFETKQDRDLAQLTYEVRELRKQIQDLKDIIEKQYQNSQLKSVDKNINK